MKCIQSLIDSLKLEIEAQKKYFKNKPLRLFSGKKSAEQNESIFIFQHNDLIKIPDNSPADILINGILYNCIVSSVNHNFLCVFLAKDIRKHIDEALLYLKPWLFLENLLEHFNKYSVSENYFKNSFDLINARFSKNPYKINPKYGESDQSQKKAIDLALESSHSYIWGPEGTGKTFTIARIIENLLCLKKRILLVTGNNHALDQVFYSILQHEYNDQYIDAITRFTSASPTSLNKTSGLLDGLNLENKIRKLLCPELARIKEINSMFDNSKIVTGNNILLKELERLELCVKEEEKSIISNSLLIGVTIYQLFYDKFIDSDFFDIVILDEANIVAFPILFWLASQATEKLIIVGSYPQLPPFSFSKKNSLYQSNIYDLLDMKYNYKITNSLMLKVQYCINHDIFRFTNKSFYMKTILNSVEKNRQVFKDNVSDNFPIVFINNCINRPVLINISPSRRVNLHNAIVCTNIVKSLLANNGSNFSIAIFTTYSDQAFLISKLFEDENLHLQHNISIQSLPSYTTQRYSVVIFDTVDAEGAIYDFSLLNDEDNKASKILINHVLTRANHKLYILGDNFYFKNYHPYDTYFNTITRDLYAEQKKVVVSNFSSILETYKERDNETKYTYDNIIDDIKQAKNEILIMSSKATLPKLINFCSELSNYKLDNLKITFLINAFKNKQTLKKINSLITERDFKFKTIDKKNKSNLVIIDRNILWFGRYDMLDEKNTYSPYKVEHKSMINTLLKMISIDTCHT